MEPLYTTFTNYTFEEYKLFCNTVNNKNGKMKLYVIILEIIIVFLAIISLNMFFAAFAVIYPFVLYFVQNNAVKKTYESNKLFKEAKINYEFYSDYFVEKNKNGEAKVEYEMLYNILETKSNFYLMIAKNQGYIIKKDNCTNELKEFIKELKKAK